MESKGDNIQEHGGVIGILGGGGSIGIYRDISGLGLSLLLGSSRSCMNLNGKEMATAI